MCPLSETCFEIFFFQTVDCFFHSLYNVFPTESVYFSLFSIYIYIFSFMNLTFSVVCKNSLPNSELYRFYLICLVKTFIVLHFALCLGSIRSIAKLTFFFFFFFAYGCSIVTAPFSFDYIFSIELLCFFKSINYLCVHLFQVSSFCFTNLCVYFFPNKKLHYLI